MTGKELYPKTTRVWACSRAEHEKNVDEGRLWWGKGSANVVPAKKKYLFEIRQGAMPKTLLEHDVVGHTDEATKELREHIPNLKLSPKPTRLIRHLMNIANIENDDILLDCNAGTGATAEAVFSSDANGEAAPSFILIEFPEKLSEHGGTLTEATRKRLISCAEKYPSVDTKFRGYVLGESHFLVWDGRLEDFDNQGKQIDLYVDNLKAGGIDDDIFARNFTGCGLSANNKGSANRACQ